MKGGPDGSLTILHVAQPTDGGVARYVADLAADQVGRGWRVHVACPSDGPLRRRVVGAGASHIPWRATRSPAPRTLLEMAGVARAVTAVHPDVVHLHSSKAGLAGRLAVRGALPTVFQPHAWSFLAAGKLAGAAAAWERLAVRWTRIIVCVSEAERGRGEKAGIRGPFRVVPNGVPVEALAEAAGGRDQARLALGLDEGPLVVCVGRLCRQKGQDVLLEAWPSVRAAVPGAALVLVGDGPDQDALRRRAVAGVRFAGRRDDVPRWMAAADVVAIPSRWEGMALTVLEAMACARSVVATDAEGSRESLGPGAGAIVPVGDAPALAAALIDRLLDPALAEAEGTAGQARAAQCYDLARTAETIASMYAEILALRGVAQPTGTVE